MTSPAAKMWGTAVRNVASTVMRPRSSAASPAFSSAQRVGRADAAHREERHVGDDALARLELQHGALRRARRAPSTRSTASPKRKCHVPLPHLVDQLVDDLGVEELERPVAAVDRP